MCLQAAHISAELERYPPAIEAFEAAAKAAVDNNLLKYSAKGYLLNAGICQLCSECSRALRAGMCKCGRSLCGPSWGGLEHLPDAHKLALRPCTRLAPNNVVPLAPACCVCLRKQIRNLPGGVREPSWCHEGSSQLLLLSPGSCSWQGRDCTWLSAQPCVYCNPAAGKVEPISSMVERYEDIDLNFGGSREHSLLKVRLLSTLLFSTCSELSWEWNLLVRCLMLLSPVKACFEKIFAIHAGPQAAQQAQRVGVPALYT